jgi:hypothetical protein
MGTMSLRMRKRLRLPTSALGGEDPVREEEKVAVA